MYHALAETDNWNSGSGGESGDGEEFCISGISKQKARVDEAAVD